MYGTQEPPRGHPAQSRGQAQHLEPDELWVRRGSKSRFQTVPLEGWGDSNGGLGLDPETGLPGGHSR